MTDITLPIDLFDASGFRWDVQGDGSIDDGTNDAYDGGLRLNNFDFFDTAQTEDDEREVVIGTSNFDEIEITRKIYVPEDQSFARFLEIVTNTGSSTTDFTVSLDSNLGSDDQTFIVDTASGDNVFNTDDNWLITDDFDNDGDPTLLHIIAGEDGELRPDAASLNFDDINFAYNLTLAPGETQIIMHFAAQNFDQAEALAKAPELEALELDALAGMSNEELEQVLNFAIAPSLPIVGTPGNDVLIGTNRRDEISGLGGNDVIEGLGGSDQISGGSGNDLIAAGNGNDTVTGDGGNDDIVGGQGDDNIEGNAGVDRILGESGNDFLIGGAGNDTILGGEDNDTIDGGEGTNNLFGGSGNDSIDGGSQSDIIFGGSGDDIISGGSGGIINILLGGDGNDKIVGGSGADQISGIDRLSGVENAEIIDPESEFGAGEIDTLTGGQSGSLPEDSDIFFLGDEDHVYYDDGDPLTRGESDLALITDFKPSEDFIQLNGSAELYSLDFFTSETGTTNADLIYDPGVLARGEVIATLQDVSPDLTLSDSAFTFV